MINNSKPRTHNLMVGAFRNFALCFFINHRSDERGIWVRGKKIYQKGQILLLVVLLSTVLVTVGLSASHLATQETKYAKLEEDSQIAFNAAEAGIEKALLESSGSIDIGSLGLGTGISGTASISTDQTQNFTTPLIAKDAQYTFYLSTYDPSTKQVTGAVFDGAMDVSLYSPDSAAYCDSDNTKLAVELNFINLTSSTIVRRLIDGCSIIEGSADEWSFDTSYTLSTDAATSHILILKVFAVSSDFEGAQITVSKAVGDWPLQGKTITSQASTSTNVEKKIELFQSYPQMAAEFFEVRF